VSACCLTPDEHYFSYIMVRTSYMIRQDDDDDVCFVLLF